MLTGRFKIVRSFFGPRVMVEDISHDPMDPLDHLLYRRWRKVRCYDIDQVEGRIFTVPMVMPEREAT